MAQYAELHCISNFSFLRGASHPEELVETAAKQRYRAIAITDECSMSGVVRAHEAAKKHGIQLIIGAEFKLSDGEKIVLLAQNRHGYGRLCHFITVGRRAAEKGNYDLSSADLFSHDLSDCLLLWIAGNTENSLFAQQLKLKFHNRVWLAVELHREGNDRHKCKKLLSFAEKQYLPCVASGDVHMHCRSRRIVQDTVNAIRHKKPLSEMGFELFANGERHLRAIKKLEKLYPPELLRETVRISRLCAFSLDELRYEYPHELVPAGHTPTSWLRQVSYVGAHKRYPSGIPEKVRKLIEHELSLIAELAYEFYFLTVWDIVKWARAEHILCQGRGSAANSTVCFCLEITEVNPAEQEMLFERFLSRERREPPDIDVDFEHERREEVIQYIYRKYGRERAALAATVITYRPRSAIRDVGKALGLSLDQVDKLARSLQWWDKPEHMTERIQQCGLDENSETVKRLMFLVSALLKFPRHLSQHVGGFVISQGPVHELVPIENASMPNRTIIQWEKDDLESLGLLKVDVLALGMLTAIRKCLDLIKSATGKQLTMADIPREDPATYAMIQKADTVGVFQIESRAQMSMLPRLKPATFYDLVVEVAIVRPGPIQGDMVHPYLERRDDPAKVEYPSEAVKNVLKRTLGVPIFQEQVMQIAIVAASFTPGEADQLRRAMAAWKRRGGLDPFEHKLKLGMAANGYSNEFSERIFKQIKGFGDYGFPESHAVSFALLAYVSSWLKCHYPAEFTAALLNSLPMGFYGPYQLIQDAQRHGVKVLAVDVQYSQAYSFSYRDEHETPCIRLGFDRVKGLSASAAQRIPQSRHSPFLSHEDLAERAQLDRDSMEILGHCGALSNLARHRHLAIWNAAGIETPLPLFNSLRFNDAEPLLRTPHEGEEILADFQTQKLTLKRHPLALLRARFAAKGIYPSAQLKEAKNGSAVSVVGMVTSRQRPGTASGVMFISLEDEDGTINVIVWPKVLERFQKALIGSRLIEIRGKLQRENGVTHVIANSAHNHSELLGRLTVKSRNFH